jgi:hypothetical protein
MESPSSSRTRIDPPVANRPWPDVWLQDSDGDWVRLHSSRAPLEEARRHVAAAAGADTRLAPLVVVVGVGAGFVIEAARERWPTSPVLAFEPEPALVPIARQRLGDAGAVETRWLAGPDYPGATAAALLLEPYLEATVVLVHPVYARVREPEMRRALEVLARITFGARENREARARFGATYLLNTLRNVPAIQSEGNVASLHGAFAGIPAVVAAAGPSLDRNIEALGPLAGRAVLVACDTALRPMLAAGLSPVFAVSVDPSELNARHLLRLPPADATWLVTEGSVSPAALNAFRGRVFVFQVTRHPPWPWLEMQGLRRGRLQAWGSVLVSALDLAFQLGCDPVVLVGADGAWTGGQPYCRGTTFEDGWREGTDQGLSLRVVFESTAANRVFELVPDVHGTPLATLPHLREFRDQVLDMARARPDRTVVNATAGGIFVGEGLKFASLAETLGERPPLDPTAIQLRVQQARPATAADAGTLRARLTQLANAPSDVEFRRWLAVLGDGDAGRTRLQQVLIEAARRLSSPGRPAPAVVDAAWRQAWAPDLAFRTRHVHPPERSAILRGLLSRHAPVEWLPTPSPLNPADAETCRAVAWDLLAPTLGCVDLGAKPGAIADPTVPATGPASASGAWPEDASLRLTRAETLLAAAVWGAHALETAPAWRTPVVGIVTPRSGLPVRPQINGVIDARLQVVRTWLSAAAVAHAATAAPGPASALLCTVGDLLARPDLMSGESPDVRCLVQLMEADGPRAGTNLAAAQLDVTVTELAPALTGLVARARPSCGKPETLVFRDELPRVSFADQSTSAQTSPRTLTLDATLTLKAEAPGDPRHWVFTSSAKRLACRVLAGCGVPCRFATGFDRERALVTTPSGSVVIDGRGAVTPQPAWPVAIVGEIPWGPPGGALAWSSDPKPVVLVRTPGAERPLMQDIPFRAHRVARLSDGAPVWAAWDGGLWTWTPDGVRRLVETPPVHGVHVEGSRVRLDPLAVWPHGGVIPTRLPYVWVYDTVTGLTQVEAADPEGPCLSSDAANGWRALAYPYSETVRVTTSGGDSFNILVYRPMAVAWAGLSLVVTTGPGYALLFEALADQLAAIA